VTKNQPSLEFVENILRNEPNNAEAWKIKGDILFLKSSFYESLECYSKSIENDQNYFDAWCAKGKTSIFLNNVLDAFQCLDKAISIKNLPEAFRLKSHAFPLGKSNQNKIQKNIKMALELDPENINYLTSQGLFFKKFNLKDKSISIFEKILSITPDNLIALTTLEYFMHIHDFNLLDFICKQFSIMQNDLKKIESIADDYFLNFDFSSARDCYTHILSHKFDYNVSKKLATIYLIRGNKNAQNLFLNLTKDNNVDSDSWVRLGETYRIQNKILEALQCFDSALEIMPKNAEAWRRKGFAQSQRHENIDDIIKCLNKSLEFEPHHPMTLTQKSMYLRRLNKTEESLSCLDKALEIDPTFILAWKQKAETFASLNNFEDALKCYEKIIKLDPDDVITWYNTGIITAKFCEIQFQTGKNFFEHEDYNKALDCFEKVLKFDPNDSETLKLKNEVISRLG